MMIPSIGRIFFYFILLVFKTIVYIYTYVTLPYFYYKSEPWIRLAKARRIRSKNEDPFDPNSASVSLEKRYSHPSMKRTLTEAINSLPKIHGRHRPALGYRDVLYEENVYDEDGNPKSVDGRILKKVRLSDSYHWLNHGQVDQIATELGRGLAANNVSSGDKILILSETRVEWMLSAIALIKMGAVVVTLFPNLGDEGLVFGINHTQIETMIISSDLLPKIRSLMPRLPTVRTIVYLTNPKTKSEISPRIYNFPKHVKLMSFGELRSAGAQESAELVVKPEPEPDDLFGIIFTSGTTGKPKPVMVTHKNMIEGSLVGLTSHLRELMPHVYEHKFMPFLPLAHILELSIELALMMAGVPMGYSSPQTMAESGAGLMRGQKPDMAVLNPTVIIAVPLVMDRMLKEIEAKIKARSILALKIFRYIMEYKAYWNHKGYECPLIDSKVSRLVNNRLGGKLQLVFVGGAPLNPHTHKMLKSALNAKIMQGYGATETMGGALITDLDDLSLGRVGPPLFNTKVKLEDWPEGGYHVTDKPDPRGEILIGGDRISPGYYNMSDFDEDIVTDEQGVRWFRTGDIGQRCRDGTFKVIDRRKDLQKLANGKFVSLGGVEAALKTCPYVENICVCGGTYSNQLVAIVSPNRKNLSALCQEMGIEDQDINVLCEDDRLIGRVFQELCLTAETAGVSEREIPVRICLVPEEWTPDNDMLTAALKMKRHSVQRKYQKMIDTLVKGA